MTITQVTCSNTRRSNQNNNQIQPMSHQQHTSVILQWSLDCVSAFYGWIGALILRWCKIWKIRVKREEWYRERHKE